MRIFSIISLFFFVLPLYSQYFDDFSDGDYSSDPMWITENMSANVISVDGQYAINLMPNNYSFDMLKGDFRTVSLLTDSAKWNCNIVFDIESVSRNYVQYHLISSALNFDAGRSLYLKFDFSTRSISFCFSNGGVETVLGTTQNNLLSLGSNRINFSVSILSGKWQIECYSNSILLWSETISYPINFSSVTSGVRVLHDTNSSTIYQLYEASCITLAVEGGDSGESEGGGTGGESGGGGTGDGTPCEDLVRGDLLFTEIMQDPTPSYGLPEVEWIEIYNNSDKTIDLYGCSLVVGYKVGTFNSYLLEPNSYVAVCSSSAAKKLNDYANCVVVTSMPTLLNDGALVVLYSAYDEVISCIDYNPNWGDSSYKADGGWSLERCDVTNPINSADTWNYSVASIGGTPAAPNSISISLQDTVIPIIIGFEIPNSTTINLHFNKEMFDEDFDEKISIADNSITSILLVEPMRDVLQITLSKSLDSIYSSSLKISDIACVSGWVMADTTLQVALPSQVGYMDVVLNEIMFNVSEAKSKFIELYNNSDKYLDISSLMICEKSNDSVLQSSKFLVEEEYVFSPHTYCVVAESLFALHSVKEFNSTSLYSEASLSFLNSTEDYIILATKDGVIIDEVFYKSDWHHPLIVDTHDVSLERIDPNANSNNSVNWHSASQLVGYNTAGWRNSQSVEKSQGDESKPFWAESNRISPNNDGNEDFFQLHYQLDKSGYMLTVNIYTRSGTFVANACNNQMLSQSGTWVWNGVESNGALVQLGLYVVTIEAIHLDGDKINKKIILIVS